MVDQAAAGAAFGLIHDIELPYTRSSEVPSRAAYREGWAAGTLAALARTLGTDVASTTFVLECRGGGLVGVGPGARLRHLGLRQQGAPNRSALADDRRWLACGGAVPGAFRRGQGARARAGGRGAGRFVDSDLDHGAGLGYRTRYHRGLGDLGGGSRLAPPSATSNVRRTPAPGGSRSGPKRAGSVWWLWTLCRATPS